MDIFVFHSYAGCFDTCSSGIYNFNSLHESNRNLPLLISYIFLPIEELSSFSLNRFL